MNNTKMKHGTLSVIITVSVIAVVVLINFLCDFLTNRYNLKADMTMSGIYEISDTTKDYIADLPGEVKIHVMSTEAQFVENPLTTSINEVLKKYASLSNGKITINYIDTLKNPDYASSLLSDMGADQILPGTLVFESSKRFKIEQWVNLYVTSSMKSDPNQTSADREVVSEFRAEERITSNIEFVLSDSLSRIVFLTGHGETELSALSSVLLANNFKVDSLNLSVSPLPEDTSLIVLNGPRTDLTEEEITYIDTFMQNGGAIIVAPSLQVGPLPRFDRFFREWGIAFTPSLVRDNDKDTNLQLVRATEESINADIITKHITTTQSRALLKLWETKQGYEVKTILTTDAIAYAETYAESDDNAGSSPYAAALLSTYTKVVNNQAAFLRVFALSSDMFASDVFFNASNLSNRSYILGAINYLCPLNSAFDLETRSYYGNRYMEVYQNEKDTYLWLAVIIMPLLILSFGLVVWLRRKHL